MFRFFALLVWLGAVPGLWAMQMVLEMSPSLTWKWEVLREIGSTQDQIDALCDEIEAKYRRYGWARSICREIPFTVFGWSEQNRPLLSYSLKNPVEGREEVAETLIHCAIHGDELAGVPMCFRMIEEIITKKQKLPQGMGITVQPLLNPDGFLAKKPQRPNARGVDLNRNFKTPEWAFEAHRFWVKRDRKDWRKFPGQHPASESETQAMSSWIETHNPQKIISIHTPLAFLELDSMGDQDLTRRAKYLAINMVKNAKNLNFKSYGVWPGSLGNYAGRLLRIPVYTMELPPGSTRRNTNKNWDSYSFSLWRAVQFDLSTGTFQED